MQKELKSLEPGDIFYIDEDNVFICKECTPMSGDSIKISYFSMAWSKLITQQIFGADTNKIVNIM